MKKCVLSLVLTFAFWISQAQNLPEIPSTVEFADVHVVLSSEARQKVSSEVQRLLTPSSYLNQKLERMQLFFPIIERILEEENVPSDLKYLAVLESDLYADAVSPTKAVGYWQFKDFTAKEMNLTISDVQDDRKNLHLSTRAAAQYLKKNNQIFKNWISSTLSYTIGAGGAANLVPVDWSFSSEIKLDKNPHPYLVKAIAHKLAFNHKLTQISPTSKTIVEYPGRGKKWSEIARELNQNEIQIKQANTWFTSHTLPTDKDYIVLIRTDKSSAPQITEKANDLAKSEGISLGYPKLKRQTTVVTSTDQPVFYEINGKKGIMAQTGDEVATLARKGKVSIYKFLSLNDLTDRDRIKDGTVYYLQKKNKKGPIPYHTVTEKQSLWDVSHMYNIRLKQLKKFNRIEKDEPIELGRVLWLQKKRPKNTPIQYNKTLVAPPEVYTTEPKEVALAPAVVEKPAVEEKTMFITHRVLENETLFSLAKKYSTTVERLRELNKLGPFENIKYNQRLIVPYTEEPQDDWVEDEETQPVLMPAKKEVAKAEPLKEEPKREVETPKKEEPKRIEITTPVLEEPVNRTESKPAPKVEVPTEIPATSSVGRHKVAKGETFFSIARKYNTTVQEIRSLNNMSASETLKFGTTLKVPVSGGEEEVRSSVSTVTKTHTVARGETLFSISKKYGVSVNDIKELNNLGNSGIQAGQKLKISGSEEKPAPKTSTSTTAYHVVKSGETLFSIANRYGVTVNQLKTWNNMKSNTLVKGKKLIVKK